MIKTGLAASLAAMFALGAVGEAQAAPVTVDYAGVGLATGFFGPYTEDGFVTETVGFGGLYNFGSSASGAQEQITQAYAGSTTRFRKSDSSAFSLVSLDIGGYNVSQTTISTTFSADLASGGTTSVTITSFGTFNFGSDFSNVTAVRFGMGMSGTAQAISFDNLVFDDAASAAIPLPAGLPLLALGLGALGLARRRAA